MEGVVRSSGDDGPGVDTGQGVAWIRGCGKPRPAGMPLPGTRHHAQPVREGSGSEAERLEILRRAWPGPSS